METLEQFTQTDTALSNQNSLTAAMTNSAVALTSGMELSGRRNVEQLSQGAFTPKLEAFSKSTGSFEPDSVGLVEQMRFGADSNQPNDSSFTQRNSHKLRAEGSTDQAKQVTEAIDSLIGIPKGGVIADVAQDDIIDTKSAIKVESALDAAVSDAKEQLDSFIKDEEFLDKMRLAFGENWQPQAATALLRNLASGKVMPDIEILSDAILNADGAFGEGTIYLSEEFLSENVGNSGAVASVLLEEIGHYIDQELNRVDSPGDEGDIFARLVRNETISDAELEVLEAEDDSTTIAFNGEAIFVEQAVEVPEYSNTIYKYVPGQPMMYSDEVKRWQMWMIELGYESVGEADGWYGPKSAGAALQFQQDKNLRWKDGMLGPETWEVTYRLYFSRVSQNPIPGNIPI
jgi:peptidoglycan hydrolase-like protein with peptidoglycan-binding domain